jgi:hypothetical protein
MSGIFTVDADQFGHEFWSDVLESNHTDPGDSKAVM